MPLYEYKCANGHTQDIFLPMSEYLTPQVCRSCGEPTIKQLSTPAVRGDYQSYRCPITNEWVEGRRAHEENLRRHNCRLLEPGEREQAVSRRQFSDDALSRSIDRSLEQTLSSWSGDKIAQLCNEAADGAQAIITRSTPQQGV